MIDQLSSYSSVNHADARANRTGEDIGGCALRKKVEHHLAGHILRECRDTRCCHAMVSCKDGEPACVRARRQGFLDLRDLNSKRFDPPQRANWFGFAVDCCANLSFKLRFRMGCIRICRCLHDEECPFT